MLAELARGRCCVGGSARATGRSRSRGGGPVGVGLPAEAHERRHLIFVTSAAAPPVRMLDWNRPASTGQG